MNEEEIERVAGELQSVDFPLAKPEDRFTRAETYALALSGEGVDWVDHHARHVREDLFAVADVLRAIDSMPGILSEEERTRLSKAVATSPGRAVAIPSLLKETNISPTHAGALIDAVLEHGDHAAQHTTPEERDALLRRLDSPRAA